MNTKKPEEISLREKIEDLRIKLNSMQATRKYENNPEIIRLSQTLDQLLVEYTKKYLK